MAIKKKKKKSVKNRFEVFLVTNLGRYVQKIHGNIVQCSAHIASKNEIVSDLSEHDSINELLCHFY
jgi:hypothetical protein